MFELENQSARVAHVNLREEKHGEEDVLACDLKFEAKMSNAFLRQLHPDLQGSLYERGSQLALDIGESVALPKLRFQLMAAPLKWEGKIVGGKVTIHAPISDDDLVIFADIGELRLSPQDGGTVIIGFRAQFLPDGDQAARLPFLLGKLVDISVQKPIAGEGTAEEHDDDLFGGNEERRETERRMDAETGAADGTEQRVSERRGAESAGHAAAGGAAEEQTQTTADAEPEAGKHTEPPAEPTTSRKKRKAVKTTTVPDSSPFLKQ
jgi:hypothetical protein